MNKLNTWEEELNSILWKNINLHSKDTRPMKPELQTDLETFILNLLETKRQENIAMIEGVKPEKKRNNDSSSKEDVNTILDREIVETDYQFTEKGYDPHKY